MENFLEKLSQKPHKIQYINLLPNLIGTKTKILSQTKESKIQPNLPRGNKNELQSSFKDPKSTKSLLGGSQRKRESSQIYSQRIIPKTH